MGLPLSGSNRRFHRALSSTLVIGPGGPASATACGPLRLIVAPKPHGKLPMQYEECSYTTVLSTKRIFGTFGDIQVRRGDSASVRQAAKTLLTRTERMASISGDKATPRSGAGPGDASSQR